MENASRALTIAGGVLIGVLTLSLLVFAWRMLSRTFQETSDVASSKVVSDFNKQWADYDKNEDNIYAYAEEGASNYNEAKLRKMSLTLMDIVSLANKLIDNNTIVLEENGIYNPTIADLLSENLYTDYTSSNRSYINTNILSDSSLVCATMRQSSINTLKDILSINGDTSIFKTKVDDTCKINHRYSTQISVGPQGYIDKIVVSYFDAGEVTRQHYNGSS